MNIGTLSGLLISGGLGLGAVGTTGMNAEVCVPAWLLVTLTGFACLPTDAMVDLIRVRFGLEE